MSSSSNNLIWSWKKPRMASQTRQKSKSTFKAKKLTTRSSCFTPPLLQRIHSPTSPPKAVPSSCQRRNPFWLLQNWLTNKVRSKPCAPLNSTSRRTTNKRPTAVLIKFNLLSKRLLKKTLKSNQEYPNNPWWVKETYKLRKALKLNRQRKKCKWTRSASWSSCLNVVTIWDKTTWLFSSSRSWMAFGRRISGTWRWSVTKSWKQALKRDSLNLLTMQPLSLICTWKKATGVGHFRKKASSTSS